MADKEKGKAKAEAKPEGSGSAQILELASGTRIVFTSYMENVALGPPTYKTHHFTKGMAQILGPNATKEEMIEASDKQHAQTYALVQKDMAAWKKAMEQRKGGNE